MKIGIGLSVLVAATSALAVVAGCFGNSSEGSAGGRA